MNDNRMSIRVARYLLSQHEDNYRQLEIQSDLYKDTSIPLILTEAINEEKVRIEEYKQIIENIKDQQTISINSNSLWPEEYITLNHILELGCSISKENKEGLIYLIKKLVLLTVGDDIIHLTKIIIVPDSSVIPSVANFLIKDTMFSDRTYTPSDTDPSNAIILPLEYEFNLECNLIISMIEIEGLSTDNANQYNRLISTLVSLLLHLRIYKSYWRRRGTISIPEYSIKFRSDIYVLANQLYNNYIVGRKKSEIVTVYPIFYDGENLNIGELWYPYPLGEILEESGEKLAELMFGMARGDIEIDDVWMRLMHIIYRYVFNPLVSEARYRDGNKKPSPIEDNKEEIRFFNDIIKPYWDEIYYQLRKMVDDNFTDFDMCINAIIESIEGFLRNIGVNYYQRINMNWEVYYHPAFFLYFNKIYQ